MKQIILLISLAFALTANAGITNETESHRIIKTITPHTDPTTKEVIYDTCHFYYNAQGLLLWEQRQTMRYTYEYNSNGQKTKRNKLSWVEADKEYKNVGFDIFTYNADGTMATMEKHKPLYNSDGYDVSKFVYKSYEDGIATTYDNYFNDELWYNYRVTLTKDDNGRIKKMLTEQNDADNKTPKWLTYQVEDITYKANGDIDSYTTTPYDVERKKAKTSETAYHYYADINSSFAPKNLTGSSTNGNVHLSWNAVANAEAYVVTFNQTYITTKTNSLDLVVTTGTREFTVQSAISDASGNDEYIWLNCADPITLTITDDNRIAVNDLSLSRVYEEVVKADDGRDREFYCMEMKWTKPVSPSTIVGYTMYYNSNTFGDNVPVQVQDPDATTFTLKLDPYEVRETDSRGDLTTGSDVPIYIVVNYATGPSAKSNVVTVNPHVIITDVRDITLSAETETPCYNIAGQRVDKTSKGIVIKDGKKVVK